MIAVNLSAKDTVSEEKFILSMPICLFVGEAAIPDSVGHFIRLFMSCLSLEKVQRDRREE